MNSKDLRVELERSNCGVVTVSPSTSPRVYKALAEIPGNISYKMTPQELIHSLLAKASTQPILTKVDEWGGPYRSRSERTTDHCVDCGNQLSVGYGDAQRQCLNCYPIQMDELVPVDEAELARLQVPTCPLCKGLMRVDQAHPTRSLCEDCSASLVEIANLIDRGLDPYLLLTTPAQADSDLNCPRCGEAMRSFLVNTLVGTTIVDLASCCSRLFFEAKSEDSFLRATRVAVQEEADTRAPLPPPLNPKQR